MQHNAKKAADFLKALAHEHRLMVLCHLAEKPHSVSELQKKLGVSQPLVSQHLKRMMDENLVQKNRHQQKIIYSLKGEATQYIMQTLYDIFCQEGETTP